ncbi:MAG: Flp pilus assembly complex ATPase component [Deltaproteobacteria bacterium]|nr:Flp pilus assembly complex ATPase component [Deltaproteobacteria bacterium]
MIAIAIYRNLKGKAKIESVPGSVLKIGRASKNDVILDRTGVSRDHAEIYKRSNSFYIADLKSKHGTFINERKIPVLKSVPVQLDDIIGIGEYFLKIKEEIVDEDEQKRKISQLTPEEELEYYRDSRVIELKTIVHNQLLDIIDLRRLDVKKINDIELRRQCDEMVREILSETEADVLWEIDQEILIKDILDEALALGPLEDLMEDAAVTEIMVNRKDQIYVEKSGKIILSPKIFNSDMSLLGIISRIVSPIGRRIDESSPMVDARLQDGSRVNAVIPPMALNGPCITIRKFSKDPFTVDNLVEFNTISRSIAEFLKVCVENRKNVVISGGTGSGKTTTLNILSSFIPEDERIVTIEDAAELQLSQDHVVRLESRPPNIEGKGEIKIRHLVKNALRMRPDRIVVGECRGGETLDMLQAMNTGHDGSLTTAHANSPIDMLSRLETMVMMSGEDLPSRAIREQIAAAVDIVVQQTRLTCGSRKITYVSEVTGIEDDKIILQDIFYFKQEGFDASGKTKGQFIATGWIPDFLQDLLNRGIDVDMGIFHN